MEKFRNLPKGTVVELTEEGKRRYLHRYVGGTMTLIKPYKDVGYDVEELDSNRYCLQLRDINRVVSYPVPKEDLKVGVAVKLRDDLEVWGTYEGVDWLEFDEEYFNGKIVNIIEERIYCGVPAFTVLNAEGHATEISHEMIERIVLPEAQKQKEEEKHMESTVTHMKHEDLKVGMKLKLREDLVDGKYYGGFEWHGSKRRSEYVVSRIIEGSLGDNFFEIAKDNVWCYTAEMFECEIKEPEIKEPEFVSSNDALMALATGKVLEQEDRYYWLEDNEVKAMLGQGALPKTMESPELNAFLKQEFKVLDELPDYTKDNPFNVGDIVVNTLGDPEPYREVIAQVGADKVRVRLSDGRVTYSGSSVNIYRKATLKEEADYWKAVALRLRQAGGC